VVAMEELVTVAIRFPELELGEAGRVAWQLREVILDDVPGAKADVEKDDRTNQDLGATLVAVLGTPAILALAHGVASWLRRRGQTIEIEIDGKRTRFRAEGPIDDNAVKIAEALSHRKQ